MPIEKIDSVNGKRLKFAREYYNIGLKEVAEKTKINEDNLRNFEDGTDFPTYSQLEKLSNYYNQSMLFFFFKSTPDSTKLQADFRSIEYNSKQILSRRIKEMIEQANLYQLNLYELNKMKDPPSFIKMLLEESVSKEDLASWLRIKIDLQIENQINNFNSSENLLDYIRQKFYDIGIYIFKDSFKEDSVSGLCVYDDYFPIIYINNKATFARQLFTVFHEIYHIYLKQTSGYFERNEEKECDTFASSFLIPESHFKNIIKKYDNFEDETIINYLARTYCVSCDAIRYRLLSLRKISKEYYNSHHQTSIRNFTKNFSGGNFYYTKISYLGKPYLNTVFGKYSSGEIKISQVAMYAGIKTSNVSKLASNFSGGKSK